MIPSTSHLFVHVSADCALTLYPFLMSEVITLANALNHLALLGGMVCMTQGTCPHMRPLRYTAIQHGRASKGVMLRTQRGALCPRGPFYGLFRLAYMV